MKAHNFLLAIIFVFCACSSDDDAGTSITDSRNNQKYRTVKIKGQVWFAENLNYDAEGSLCYENKPANCAKYGRLYNWSTAKIACPPGWHLPGDEEWKDLTDSLGAGARLKAESGWNNNGNGTDDYGFSALPGGSGSSSNFFSGIGNIGNWWSVTEDDDGNLAYVHTIYNNDIKVLRNPTDKTYLFSVRCLQDYQ